METTVRRKMSMAKRALDFALANPSTDASYVAVVAQLQGLVTQTDALSVQQQSGLTREQGALAHRRELRAIISEELHHLVAVAERAAITDPELAKQFVNPASGVPNRVFITAARTMLAAATPQKDQFVPLGLGETFIDDLMQAVNEFDETTETAHTGRRDHVAASASLIALSAQDVKLVTVLDGLNRARFRNDPAMLAAWESSKNLTGPFRPQEQVPAPLPAPGPVPVSGAANPVGQGTPATGG